MTSHNITASDTVTTGDFQKGQKRMLWTIVSRRSMMRSASFGVEQSPASWVTVRAVPKARRATYKRMAGCRHMCDTLSASPRYSMAASFVAYTSGWAGVPAASLDWSSFRNH